MAGKHYHEFDERKRDEEAQAEAVIEVWTEQLRQAKADLLCALAISADAPNPGLIGFEVYTEMHCPACGRIIYWKAMRFMREFFCFGCDLWPRECKCSVLVRKPPELHNYD